MGILYGGEHQEVIEGIMSPEEINRLYNEHRHALHIKNGYKKSSLISDDINQMIYPRNPGTMKMFQSFILETIEAYTDILPNDREIYESLIKKLFYTLDHASAIIITNHATFAGIPIIISELHKYAKMYNKKQVREKINTVLGPALLTQSQKKVIQAISTLWKTIPTTKQSEIPAFDLAVENNRLTEHPHKKIKKEFIRNFISKGDEPGNIFLIAPTGTRDVLEWTPYKTIKNISFSDDQVIQNTLKAINCFVQKGNMILLAGVNETAMKVPGYAGEKNNSWSKGSTHITLKELTPETYAQLIKDKGLMHELASLIKDNYGNIIGRAVSEDQLKKNETQNPRTIDYEFKDYTFTDTIKKKIIRKIFEITKDS
ncbi:MAG TPA: hypothetical protein PKC87_03755 [Candidatus Absconditabacterales bacterium]|nr:hypothetical protein [Candidatus Absconditabacterales bacterium]